MGSEVSLIDGVATYSCKTGYTLNAEKKSTVCKDGHWKGEVPLCHGKTVFLHSVRFQDPLFKSSSVLIQHRRRAVTSRCPISRDVTSSGLLPPTGVIPASFSGEMLQGIGGISVFFTEHKLSSQNFKAVFSHPFQGLLG